MTIGKIIVWLIIGALSGNARGPACNLQQTGFWILGITSACSGRRRRRVFWLFGIDLVLGEIKITVEDLISALVGSMLCLGAWWLIRKPRAECPEAKTLKPHRSRRAATREIFRPPVSPFLTQCAFRRFPKLTAPLRWVR